MEEKQYDEELDVDVIDDDDIDDADYEDEEDEALEDEDIEDEGEEEDSEVEGEKETEETSEESDDVSEEKAAAGEKEFAMKMLSEMGYSGTYEEAKAAYEADRVKTSDEKGASNGATEGTPGDVIDYDEMARNMLAEINKEFGLDIKSFSEFDDLSTFATLAVNDKVGAIKAFRATNHRLIDEAAKKAAITTLPKAKRTVQTLPKSDGGSATVKGQTITKRELREYMDAFPELSRDEAIKLIKRVKKN